MKIYTMLSQSHRILFDNYFYKSLVKYEPNVELIIIEAEQLCSSGSFYDKGWKESMKIKIDAYVKACQDNMGSYFIWSDVDIEFYSPFVDSCLEELEDRDMAFQYSKNDYCAGFFICRCNEKTLAFFKHIQAKYDDYGCDQRAINENINMIDAKTFSNKFWSVVYIFDFWEGQDFNLNHNIIMAHATYTIGIQNKILLLNKVRDKIKNKGKIMNLSIKRALYGSAQDVTEKLFSQVASQPDPITINSQTMGCDPAPGVDKYLYLYDQSESIYKTVRERDTISKDTLDNHMDKINNHRAEGYIWDKSKQ